MINVGLCKQHRYALAKVDQVSLHQLRNYFDKSLMTSSTNTQIPRDFDFIIGDWRVQHRRLNARLCGCTDWTEFVGTSSTRKILNGLGNVEDNVLHFPDGAVNAAALRSFNVHTQEWAIWCLMDVIRITSTYPWLASSQVKLVYFLPTILWMANQSKFVLRGEQIRAETQFGNRHSQMMVAQRGKQTGSWNFSAGLFS